MSNHSQGESAAHKDSILKSESPKLDESSSRNELSLPSPKEKMQSEASNVLSSPSAKHELIHHIGKNAWEIKDGNKSYLLGGIEIKVRRKAEKNKTNNRNLTNLDDELQRQAKEHPPNQRTK